MNEENSAAEKNPMDECAAQLGSAAQALERVIGKLEAQYEAINQKIDRIIATVEKPVPEKSAESEIAASAQLTRLETENRELRHRAGRKTLVAGGRAAGQERRRREHADRLGHAGQGPGSTDHRAAHRGESRTGARRDHRLKRGR